MEEIWKFLPTKKSLTAMDGVDTHLSQYGFFLLEDNGFRIIA